MSEPLEPDKRRKAHPSEVDISNGALFLRIADLERWVNYLKRKVDSLERDANDPVKHNIGIGGER